MTADVATRLLDAQVDWILGELSGERLTALIERDVDDVLALADGIAVTDAVSPAAAQETLRRAVDLIGGGALVEDMVVALSDALYDLAAGEQHLLGEVVDRDLVDALITKLLSMQTLHDRSMERLAQSPLVGTVAARFVSQIISDFVAQNRQLAERLPGAKSLFSLGSSAASRVRNVSLIGDAAERGTQLAIRRTNTALRDVLREAPLKEAALEVWDLHANEPVSELREYLSQQELRDLLLIVHELIVSARSTDYVRAALDECVDVFFARYGEMSVTALLAELGVSRDDVLAEALRSVPRVVEAARADGRLAGLVRARLEPFFGSPQVQAILAGTSEGGPASAPAKKAAPKPASAPAKKAAPRPAAKKATTAKKAAGKKSAT